jgi:phytoene desaturase
MVADRQQAIVIGAGIGGLASAIRLAKSGKNVIVFEANAFYGGKINSRQFGSYRFDMGPSIFTCPDYIKELYELCNADFSQFVYQKAKSVMHYFYPDGKRFHLTDQLEDTIRVLSDQFDTPQERIRAYFERAGKNYDLIAPLFIERSLHRFSHLWGKELFKALGNLSSYGLKDTMHTQNKSYFDHPGLVQFFNRFSTYNGSDPYQTPAMLNMISHLEYEDGVYVPQDGMIQITRSLYELALHMGVAFNFEDKVHRIIIENGRAVGVEADSGIYRAGTIFSNMDIAYTYEKLMPEQLRPKRILAQERSSSAVVFYWGIKKSFPELDLHNILFSADYKKEFEAIFRQFTVPDDPTIYINITSKYVPGDAPEGGENWFTMINSPVIKQQDWHSVIPHLRARMIQKINRTLDTNIEPLIEEEFVMDPLFIDKTYSGKLGAIYGNSSNSAFAAFYRHPNFSKNIKGLYFVGVTVHPGGGIPLALNSAKIAVRCMEEDERSGKL